MGQRAATTYFTSCLSLHRPSECKTQCAAPGSPPAISLSASPRLTGSEVDHERVRERLDPKKKKSLGSTPCPYLCSQRVMEGKQHLNRFVRWVDGRSLWQSNLHKHNIAVLKQLFHLVIFTLPVISHQSGRHEE